MQGLLSSPPINVFPHGHLLSVLWREPPSLIPPPPEPTALWSASVWMSVTLKCFGKPYTERPCGRVSFGQALSTLVRTPERKTHFFWCDRGAQKQSSSRSPRRTPRESNTGEPNFFRAGTKESPHRPPSSPSSHGRTPSRNAVSGPAPRFPWEYTVLPVCCYHLSLWAEEKQGSQEPSSRRTKVIPVLKRHFRIISSRRRPPQRRAEGRYCAARLHALHIQDVLGRGEART